MLNEKWFTILVFSFLFVAFVNAMLASCTKIYYKNRSSGHLSHSQLRIKQGNATFEHRLNVFGQTLIFCFVTFRIYLISFMVWLAFNGAIYFSTLIEK
jgi:hypothetical protein